MEDRGLMEQEHLIESEWETLNMSLNVEVRSYMVPEKDQDKS